MPNPKKRESLKSLNPSESAFFKTRFGAILPESSAYFCAIFFTLAFSLEIFRAAVFLLKIPLLTKL